MKKLLILNLLVMASICSMFIAHQLQSTDGSAAQSAAAAATDAAKSYFQCGVMLPAITRSHTLREPSGKTKTVTTEITPAFYAEKPIYISQKHPSDPCSCDSRIQGPGAIEIAKEKGVTDVQPTSVQGASCNPAGHKTDILKNDPNAATDGRIAD